MLELSPETSKFPLLLVREDYSKSSRHFMCNFRPLETVVSPQGFRSKDRAQKQSGSTFASRQRGRGDPSDPRPKRGDPKDRTYGPWEPETIVKSGKTSVRDASGLSSLKLCGLTKPFDAY